MPERTGSPIAFRTRCFSLIELMIVISVILLLAAMIVVALNRSRAKARYTRWLAYSTDLQKDSELIGQWLFTGEDRQDNLLNNRARGLERPDYHQSDYHATAVGVPLWTRGRWDEKGGMTFPNTTAMLVDKRLLDPRQSHTVAAWVLPVPGGNQPILQQLDANGTGRAILSLDGAAHLVNDYAGNSYTSGIALEAGIWHHVAISYDAEDKLLTLFVDGVIDQVVGPVVPEYTEGGLHIGANQALTVGNAGVIDEVEIVERAMSEVEVRDMFRMGAP